MNIFKLTLVFIGTISLGIGTIGIFIPGLPTTPFLLLTAGLYIKSSDKLYQKLISTRIVGSYILEYQNIKGMTKKTKLFAIAIMWIMTALSCIFFITPITLKLAVLIIACIGTLVMGIMVPTVNISNKNR